MAEPKIAYLDIETAPLRGYTWGIWEQDVIEVEQDWFMLSFAVQWNDGPVKVYALPDYKGYGKEKTNDERLVSELWKVFDRADIIVAHNGDKFDIKKANARFIVHGFNPPSPYKTIDTLKIARKHFKFDSNRLDDLARYLDVGRKLPTSGKSTWLGCMSGEKKAWDLMKKYNKQDIVLLKGVHDRLHRWATIYPNMAVYKGGDGKCPHCTSTELIKRGFGYSKTGRYQRYQCLSCGSWSSGKSETVVSIK